MRRLLSVALIALALPAWGRDLVERVQIPRHEERGVYVASLLPMRYAWPLFQVIGPSGGGGGGLVPGSTTFATCTVSAIFYNDASNIFQCNGLTEAVSGSTWTLATPAGTNGIFLATEPAAAAGASVAGKTLALTASAAVASTDTDGAAAGGAVTITAGAAARRNSGNANGGAVVAVGGAAIGAGTRGIFDFTNTLQAVGPVGTLTNPTFAFSGLTNTGLYTASSSLAVSNAGVDIAAFSGSGMRLASGMLYGISSGSSTGANSDVMLSRAAASVWDVLGASGNPGWMRQKAGDMALNADYTNATASFTNTALVTALISGRTYNFKFTAFFVDSTAADGAQFNFNQNALSVTNFRAQCFATNAAGATLVITNGASVALATAVQVALALTTEAQLTCEGTIVPSASGNFGVQAAQTAHSTGTLTVSRGSKLQISDANPL